VSGIELQLDARGFRWTPHKNKYGKDYPTNADASATRPRGSASGQDLHRRTLSVAGVLGVTLGLTSLQANRTADESIRRALAGVRRGVQAFLAGGLRRSPG